MLRKRFSGGSIARPRTALKLFAAICLVTLLAGVQAAVAQDQSQAPTSNSSQNPADQSQGGQDSGKPKQDVPPEAGGPGDSVGPYAIPRKSDAEAPPPPRPVAPKKWRACPTIPSR